MTFDTERVRIGRQPVTIIEIDLDYCANTFGVAPCTATGSGDAKCFNTRATCLDPNNYNNTSILTYKWSDRIIDGETYIPCIEMVEAQEPELTPGEAFGIRAQIRAKLRDFPHHDRGIDPYISSRTYTPESQGTYFGKLFARNPYWNGRPMRFITGYIAADGTLVTQTENYIIDKFEGPDDKGFITIIGKDILKLADDERAQCPEPSSGTLAANITAAATSLTVDSGTESDYIGYNLIGTTKFLQKVWIEGTKWSIDTYGQAAHASGTSSDLYKEFFLEAGVSYVVTFTLSGYTSGNVTPKFAGGTTAYGTARSSNGTFTETIVANTGNYIVAFAASVVFVGTLSVVSVRKVQEYIRIGDEIIYSPYADRSANVFSNLTRAAFNTTANSHNLGDAVQSCSLFNNMNVIDALEDLIINYARVDASYIIRADWEAVRDIWLSGASITNVLISEPTGVKTLCGEISEQLMVLLWWDSINQTIKLKAWAPEPTTVATIDEDSNLVGNVRAVINPDSRTSRVLISYNVTNPLNMDKPSDFQSFLGYIDSDRESPNEFGDKRIKEMLSRWITTDAQANTTGSRTKNQLAQIPKTLFFTMDAKDANIVIGDFVTITTRALQDRLGANNPTQIQIISRKQRVKPVPGSLYDYKAIISQFGGRYAVIMAATASSTYSTATDAEKAAGCYIVTAGNNYFTSDGGEAYKIA